MITHDMFAHMLRMQLTLQQEKMKDGDPRHLDPDARAVFMTWNAFALDDEIHEAMQEVGWKPWAKNRDINPTAFVKEMVDAFHFFMNMLLAGSGVEDPEDLAAIFYHLYMEKNAINAKRQDEGYTGLEKCPQCHRDLKEVPHTTHTVHDNKLFCTPNCVNTYIYEEK